MYKKLVTGPDGPIEIDMTPEEIAQRQAEENAPPPTPSQLEQLKTIFTSLPVEQQAQFGALASAVFLFLSQNNPEAAKLVIQNADAPPGMEAVKQQMLDVFGGA